MWKRWRSKETYLDCLPTLQMLILSMGSQGLSSRARRSVRDHIPLLSPTEKRSLTEHDDDVPDTYALEVESGKTYLLRIINAALNDDLFFAIAGHSMTVVEIDAAYCKPFNTSALVIAPGQTTNVLVRADQAPGRYFMATRSFMDIPIPVDNKTATAILQYRGVPTTVVPVMPQLPAPNDTSFVASFGDQLRSLNSPRYPASVPLDVDRRLFYTIGFGVNPCPTCLNGTRLTASLNNITFVLPQVALLQAHYYDMKGVFRSDFPDKPPTSFNYTGAPLTANLGTSLGTRLSRIAFNSTVELVLQDTNLMVESHPFHLHGYNFYVVGTGIGNFDPAKDPANFNLIDPPERNTVGHMLKKFSGCRGLVHALSSGSPHELGAKDGFRRGERRRAGGVDPTSADGSSTMLS
ncbi:hypothetical protein BHE74_00006302 [Ensete ventricosum]|nr:hypothetical protein BHE74_00006302 [Ensete ventricosum]